MQSPSVMKLRPLPGRAGAKERVLGRRVLPFSSSVASLSCWPQVASATLRDLKTAIANSHSAAPQRTEALCRAGEELPAGPSSDSWPLGPEYAHRTLHLPSCAEPIPAGRPCKEPGELFPLFFWALRPFRGEKPVVSSLMRAGTADRCGGRRRCDHPY